MYRDIGLKDRKWLKTKDLYAMTELDQRDADRIEVWKGHKRLIYVWAGVASGSSILASVGIFLTRLGDVKVNGMQVLDADLNLGVCLTAIFAMLFSAARVIKHKEHASEALDSLGVPHTHGLCFRRELGESEAPSINSF